MRTEKTKKNIEWVVGQLIRLKRKKTYWSIAVPYFLMLIGYVGNKIDGFIEYIDTKLEITDGFLNTLWWILKVWMSIDMPLWGFLLVTAFVLIATGIYVLELIVKSKGGELTVDSISQAIEQRFFRKLEAELKPLKETMLFQPDRDWCNNQCSDSILDLGPRYTPELHVGLKISEVFDGLSRNDRFVRRLHDKLDEFLMMVYKLSEESEVKSIGEKLKPKLDRLKSSFQSIKFEGVDHIPFDELLLILSDVKENVNEISKFFRDAESKIQEEKQDWNFYHKYGYEIKGSRECLRNLNNLVSLFESPSAKLSNSPFLLLTGEAGIGKSHLLGDAVSNRMNEGLVSLFLLGQSFISEDDIWVQIAKKLKIPISDQNKVLTALNEFAQKENSRVIIFIDAINEGKGRYIWPDSILSFIETIGKFDWIGCVLSVRTTYRDLIFKDVLPMDGVVEIEHYGFRDDEFDAVEAYFNNYGLELPSAPLLYPEFHNPLFLKLFCQGLKNKGLSKAPDGIHGITTVINLFVEGVNSKLSKPKEFDYSESSNLVKACIDKLVQFKLDKGLTHISYDEAIRLVNEVVSPYTNERGFLDKLISEGVLTKNLFRTEEGYEDSVYMAYERFEDHAVCSLLLGKVNEVNEAFQNGGTLYEYVKDEISCFKHKGLVDALSIQLPEHFNRELFEFVGELKEHHVIWQSFLESLLWRKKETINDGSLDYVNNVVLTYEHGDDLFWEYAMNTAVSTGHYFDAHWLHDYLSSFSMADRDSWWTQDLRYKNTLDSSYGRLIQWARNINDASHISDASLLNITIALSWMFTSTNRGLRDSATKAAANILRNRQQVGLQLLEKFSDVNDPYVKERVMAAVYGSVMLSNVNEVDFSGIAEYVYENVFNTEEVYPHVLFRDYARGILEYYKYLSGEIAGIDMNKVRPPYKSSLPSEFPTEEEIAQKYELERSENGYKKKEFGQVFILSSMTTEYGRGGMYGDFGRYTFQSALRNWKLSSIGLSNLAINWIFEKYGYDIEKHGEFDRDIGHGRGRDTVPNERIGKKYQWISLHEMIARVSDNHVMTERYGSKKEIPFGGPWEPTVRDIDPTQNLRRTERPILDVERESGHWWLPSYDNWDADNKSWANDVSDLPSVKSLIELKDENGEEWLVLFGYPGWQEPKSLGDDPFDIPLKKVWIHLNGYLIKNKDHKKFLSWSRKQDYMGLWMPNVTDIYQLFSREFYWSPAYRWLFDEYFDDKGDWSEVHEKSGGKYICDVVVPTENYLWQAEEDKSQEDGVGHFRPNKLLFDGMNMRYGIDEGEFMDENSNLISFDPSVKNKTKGYHLVKKAPFLNFLRENDLQVVWTVLGEKQIIGGRGSQKFSEYRRSEFSGSFSLGEDIKISDYNLRRNT